MIPKTQNLIAVALQNGIALRVTQRVICLSVLSAVELDDDTIGVAGEVNDVRPDGRLASEMRLALRPLPQMQPKLPLGIGHMPAQTAGERNARVFSKPRTHRADPPTPNPSPPQAGGGEPVCAGRKGSTYYPTPPPSVASQASPQAFASSRTRRM